jgi:ABC-type multidrug transport system fused ATPase/permease subunit
VRIVSNHHWHSSSLIHYLRPQWPRLLLLGVLLVGATALQLINPRIVRYFIDTARSGGAVQTLYVAAALFLGIGVLSQVGSVLATYVGANVGWNATNRLRADLFAHCLSLDMPFHHTHTPGDLIQRIDGDVGELANFFSMFAVNIAGSVLLLIGVLVALFRESFWLGLGFTGFALVALLVLHRVRATATPFWRIARKASSELWGFVEERLGGIADLRANGALEYIERRHDEVTRTQFHSARRAGLVSMVVGQLSGLILTFGSVGALAVGVYLFQAGRASIGTVYLIVSYAGLLLRPLRTLSVEVDDLQKASASLARIQELLQISGHMRDGLDAGGLPRAPSVAFRDVSFSYGAGDAVLQNVSFDVWPGHVLGLLGRTGSGKTTVARLLARLYDPSAGTIKVGGIDIRRLRLAELRRGIGVVTQDVQLFHATVRDNLTFFDPAVPDHRILRALEDLGLSGWYAALPHGLDTELAPTGARLSAGEAQLLAFVRIFLKDPGLVILDEASSRLDPATERLVQHAVDRLLHNRTAIVIAHRLATVERADDILILENGRVREYGRREALARDSSSRLRQLLDAGSEQVST